MPGYGTLPVQQRQWDWEKQGHVPSLVSHVAIAIVKQLAALLLLFWTVFYHKTFLMSCDARLAHVGQWAYLCEYTKTFIRCFPLIAAAVVVVVGNRQMLQVRIYYGLLKRGALLDFKNNKAWHSPLFFILVVSFLHGCGHLALDLFIRDGVGSSADVTKSAEWQEELKSMGKNYVVPCVIFFAFLWSSFDLEAALVPLSKYFEEDPEAARRLAAQMPFLTEDAVRDRIPSLSLKTSHAPTTLEAVYHEIIEHTPESSEAATAAGVDWHLFITLWPAQVLLDPKLVCDEHKGFRRLFICVVAFSIMLMTGMFVYFVYQAHEDVWDVYGGQYEDGLSLVVLLAHAAVCAWILFSNLRLALIIWRG